MDDMIYRNNSIAEENIDPTATRQRTNLKNGAKTLPNGQTSAIKTKR